jgi:hypothetical protein
MSNNLLVILDDIKIKELFLSVCKKEWLYFFLIITAGALFAAFKLNDLGIDQTLWAEDGTIFVNQARCLGISSLWVTYAGYFHLYPRLVAWFSSLFDLEFTPLIFLLGWFVAYVSLIYVAVSRTLYYKFNVVEAGILVILMLAQPHSGEVFFTLTNAQWFMGAALAIYLLIPVKNKVSIYEEMIILIAALTGPFALLLTPIMLMQIVVYRDWKNRKHVYILVGLGAVLQLIAILISHRLSDGGLDKNISHWLIAFLTFMSFGQTSVFLKAITMFFWVTLIYCFFLQRDRVMQHFDEPQRLVLFFFYLELCYFF